MSGYNLCAGLLLGLSWQVMALADPTAPEMALTSLSETATAQAVATTPKLSLIRISGAKRSAVINGQLVREGDQVAQYKVQRIRAQQVILQHDAQPLVLNLFHPTKK